METLHFRDFTKRVISTGLFSTNYESFESLMESVNQWLSANNVRVVNTESIYGIDNGYGSALEENLLGVRVWYCK